MPFCVTSHLLAVIGLLLSISNCKYSLSFSVIYFYHLETCDFNRLSLSYCLSPIWKCLNSQEHVAIDDTFIFHSFWLLFFFSQWMRSWGDAEGLGMHWCQMGPTQLTKALLCLHLACFCLKSTLLTIDHFPLGEAPFIHIWSSPY